MSFHGVVPGLYQGQCSKWNPCCTKEQCYVALHTVPSTQVDDPPDLKGSLVAPQEGSRAPLLDAPYIRTLTLERWMNVLHACFTSSAGLPAIVQGSRSWSASFWARTKEATKWPSQERRLQPKQKTWSLRPPEQRERTDSSKLFCDFHTCTPN